MNRRSFFQTLFASASALSLFSYAQAEERRRGGNTAAPAPAQLIDPKDPGAKAVSYVHDNKDIKDKALQTERSAVAFKDQRCVTCSFYQKDKETKVGGKTAAPCQMPFATGKVVAERGWCTSWAKKG